MMLKHIAEELKNFFEETLQNVEPFYSPDIQKGTIWLETINTAIGNSSAGILCLTKENHMKPWVLFESGALSRVGVVCPIVFDMEKQHVKSPLNIFQASDFNAKEFKKLFEDISQSCGTNLNQKIIDRIFDEGGRFEKLFQDIQDLLSNYSDTEITKDETLELLTNIDVKLNSLISEKDSIQNDVKYIEILVTSFLELLNNISIKDRLNQKSRLQRISMSLDYLVSQIDSSDDYTDLVEIVEKINQEVESL